MNTDKRTVSTDALETLGMIHTREEKRDAIHLAVLPAIAGRALRRAMDVGLRQDGKADYVGTDYIGIVDPFLPGEVEEGQSFWLVIYPRVISSLRHVWTHPEIPDEPGVQAMESREYSRQWLERFAEQLLSYDPDGRSKFDMLISNAEEGYFPIDIEYGEGLSADNEELWMHFERYTGRRVINRPTNFRCSC
jgi:hypothetical protein